MSVYSCERTCILDVFLPVYRSFIIYNTLLLKFTLNNSKKNSVESVYFFIYSIRLGRNHSKKSDFLDSIPPPDIQRVEEWHKSELSLRLHFQLRSRSRLGSESRRVAWFRLRACCNQAQCCHLPTGNERHLNFTISNSISEVTTVINKPNWLIYHIRSNDDNTKAINCVNTGKIKPGNPRMIKVVPYDLKFDEEILCAYIAEKGFLRN